VSRAEKGYDAFLAKLQNASTPIFDDPLNSIDAFYDLTMEGSKRHHAQPGWRSRQVLRALNLFQDEPPY
jgi:hypothetical protein